MKAPDRKRLRLESFDYGQPGGYFVTFCTRERKNLLGKLIVGPDALIGPVLRLSTVGEETKRTIESAEKAYPNVKIIYTIMPNHVHLMLEIHSCESGPMRASGPTAGMIVRSIKTLVTRRLGQAIWQEKFYDHVVRNQEDYLRILKYMEENPAKWAEDRYYNDQES